MSTMNTALFSMGTCSQDTQCIPEGAEYDSLICEDVAYAFRFGFSDV